MARRHGGLFSPGEEGRAPASGDGGFRGARRTRAGGRVNLLFLAPLPLIWAAFTGGPTGLLLNLCALGLLLLAAWLTREGILAQEAFEARKVARRPAVPRKIFASVATGLGLALAGYAAGGGFLAPVIYAGLGGGLHALAFGLDPLRDKGLDEASRLQTDRVARVVDRAETYLAEMSAAIRRAGDREAEARLKRFQATVRAMLRTVEEDPRDLTAARRYLGVYLMGARDATARFADLQTRSHDAAARANYIALLSDLEENFTAKTRTLLQDSSTDLEIEIDVLRERLAREGIRLDNTT